MASSSQRTFQDDSGPYVLPNDSEEHARLDRQVHAFLKIMGGRTFHAPLKSPKKVLDVGCGTGILTVQLAKMFPEAQVIGIDIAPVPVHRHGNLPNLTYIQGDIAVLAAERKEVSAGTFDYVFSRLMMFAITDWPTHIKTLINLLTPGGFLELHDPNFEIHAGPNRTTDGYPEGTNLTATWNWHRHFVKDCAAGGLDMFCGKHLASWMEAAGAENVKEKIYQMPPGGPRDASESDREFWDKTRQMQGALIEKVCSRRNDPETVERLKREMWETLGELKEGDCSTMHVVFGTAK